MTELFDAFLFSESHEADLLLAKLTIEAEMVSRWFAVENAYTIKGEPKPLTLERIMETDERFVPFRDRVSVISISENFVEAHRRSFQDWTRFLTRVGIRPRSRSELRRGFREQPFFFSEWEQRRAAVPAILDAAGGAGWVLVSDVDEFLDVSQPSRRATVAEGMKETGATKLLLPRLRYAYDIDNLSSGTFRTVPLLRIAGVASGHTDLGTARVVSDGFVNSGSPLVFEYSYCYSRAHIRRKLETFTHEDPGTDVADRALRCNHSPKEPSRSRIDPVHWYEQVELREDLHPEYVLEHASELRTGVVNPEYREARRRYYPELFPG